MSYEISVDQDQIGPGEWRFIATFIEKDPDGTIDVDVSAEVCIDRMSSTIDNEFFLEGARLALAKLEAETS